MEVGKSGKVVLDEKGIASLPDGAESIIYEEFFC
jgi:hypothetical protein